MVLKIENTHEFYRRIIETLKNGKVVALPTDTVYGFAVDGTHYEAVQRLAELKVRREKSFTFFMPKKDFNKYARITKKRIIEYFVPGPITVILKKRTNIALPFIADKIGIRIPQTDFIIKLLGMYGNPLAVTSANVSGQEPMNSALEIAEQFTDVDTVIDGGILSSGPSTVLDLTETPPKLMRKGTIPILEIEKVYGKTLVMDHSLKFHVLFLCAGNTCRSPMAEGIFKTFVSSKHCEVKSAGILPMWGLPPAPFSVEVVNEYGGSIAQHLTQSITHELIDWADLILVMEFKQYNTVLEMSPRAAVKTFLMKEYKRKTKYNEIADPVGKDIQAYRQTARAMYPSLKFVARDIEKRFKETKE